MDNRNLEQKKAVKAWMENKGGTILGCTGFGKTKTACDIISQLNPESVQVIVPSLALKQTWNEEIGKWLGDKANVSIECTKSVYDKTDTIGADLLILDEAHLMLGEKYISVFNIAHNSLLCLTATLPHNTEKSDKLTSLSPVVYQIDVEEARDKVIVSDFDVYNLPVTMNSKESFLYSKFNIQFLAARAELTALLSSRYKKYDLFKEARKYSSLQLQDLNDEFEHKMWKASKDYWTGMSMRKKVVQSAEDKLIKAVQIIEKFPDKKWIIFSKKISDVDKLHKILIDRKIKAVKYHSKMKKAEKEESLQKAENADVIVSAEALSTGYNLPTLSGAISLSYTGEPVTFIQSLGRTIRFEKNKKSIYVNLYTKGTQEEKWLESRTSSYKTYFIKDIKDIK